MPRYPLPPPRTGQEEYLAAILEELVALRAVVAELRPDLKPAKAKPAALPAEPPLVVRPPSMPHRSTSSKPAAQSSSKAARAKA